MCRVFVVDNDPGEAEVSNLGDEVLADEDVPGGQVTVDQALSLKMSHPAGNL